MIQFTESVPEEARERADKTPTVLSDGPAEVDAPRGEAGSEGGEHEAVAVRELPVLVLLGEGNGNGPAHGVPVAIEIDDDAVEA